MLVINDIPREDRRILVVDDESIVRVVLQELLSSMGYEVCCAQDGTEALSLYANAKLRGQSFAAVILDYNLPDGMNGHEILERLRTIDPQVIAILSSGYTQNPMMANYARYGFHGILPKPYTPQQLFAVLHDVLRVRER
jgi:CheY-like chemotaxis protein